MKFGGANELGIATAVRPFRKTLHADPEQALAQEHYKLLELLVTEVLVGKFHPILIVSPSC